MRIQSAWFLGLFASASLLWTGSASANPRPLLFTYTHEQLGEGASEIEQFADFTPVRTADAEGTAWYGFTQFQTELEHGLTDRLELGLYLTIVPSDLRALDGNGLKQRLRFQLAPSGEWPIDVALYGEVVENEREVEFEEKIILQRRFGSFRLAANLTVEQELYYSGEKELVLAPSAGATFEITPSIHAGLEWWMRWEKELGEEEEEEAGEEAEEEESGAGDHFVGPTVLFQFGELWWSTGVYVRVSNLDEDLEPGEEFGRIWARSAVGLGF